MSLGTVLRRKRDSNGDLIGRSNANPFLDKSEYDIGEVETYTANVIAEHIFKQADKHGNTYQLMDEIIDHQKKPKEAVRLDDAFIIVNGRQCRRTHPRVGSYVYV